MLTWQQMSYSVCHASLLHLFNDCSVSTIGQELSPHNLEAEDGGAGGRCEAALLQALLQDHVTQEPGPVYTRLP